MLNDGREVARPILDRKATPPVAGRSELNYGRCFQARGRIANAFRRHRGRPACGRRVSFEQAVDPPLRTAHQGIYRSATLQLVGAPNHETYPTESDCSIADRAVARDFAGVSAACPGLCRG